MLHVACYKLHVTCFKLHVACYKLHATCLTLHVACCVSHVSNYMSHALIHILHVTCSNSHITCHSLHATCYVSYDMLLLNISYMCQFMLIQCQCQTCGLMPTRPKLCCPMNHEIWVRPKSQVKSTQLKSYVNF